LSELRLTDAEEFAAVGCLERHLRQRPCREIQPFWRFSWCSRRPEVRSKWLPIRPI